MAATDPQTIADARWERPLDVIEAATRQLVAHAEGLLSLGRELDRLPNLARSWTDSDESVSVRADLVQDPNALIAAWLDYTDVLRPSPTISMKRTASGFGSDPWEQVELLAGQAQAVDIRMIIGDDALDEATHRALRYLTDHGMRLRLMHEPPTVFFSTIDGTSALSTVWDAEQPTEMLVLGSRPIATALLTWFEVLWAHAIPYGVSSSRWLPVLELLDRGLSDHEIAEHLGWSVRTVRRRIANAMDDLDVQNRFALGRAWGSYRR